MRLSRIIMALTVGLAMAAVPTMATAAPQPPPLSPSPTVTDPPQPPPYTPALPSLTVNRPTIVLGESVVLTGRNFAPREWVDIEVTRRPLAAPAVGAVRSDGSTIAMAPVAFQASTPLRVRADANGVFTREYTPTQTGLLTITATGRDSGRSDSVELRVLAQQQPQPQLPVTGSSLDTPMKVGGGLVATGALLLLGTMLWRRRGRLGGAN